LIANNTIIAANSRSRWGASLGVCAGSSPDAENNKKGSMNIRIVNNIVTYPKSQVYLSVEEGSVNVYCDYNLYFGLPKSQFDWKGKGLTWEELKNVTGQEEHAIFKDPQFKNPARGDYHLQPQSPAKGAGIPIDQMAERDISGAIRPNKMKPSLGALE
jgi:hypothetical protein